jgi:hypothetical protein
MNTEIIRVEMKELAIEIQAFASANYDKGYDAIVECWELLDVVEFIIKYEISTLDGFIEEYQPILDNRMEVELEIF